MNDCDSLSSDEQAKVPAQWAESIERSIEELDLQREFREEGVAYWELDGDGHPVMRVPSKPGE